MYCPSCRGEFVAGIARCATCDVDLVDALPREDDFSSAERMAKQLEGQDLEAIVVGNYASLQEAQRVLARAHIPSIMAGEEGQEVEPSMHARFYLLVAATAFDEARQVFEERWKAGLQTEGVMITERDTSLASAPPNVCPACGGDVPPTIPECPECGLHLGVGEEPPAEP